MKRKLELLLLTFIMFFLPCITIAVPSAYIVDKHRSKIYRCYENLGRCRLIKLNVGDIKPISVAASKDGKAVVISAEDNHLYVCQRNSESGDLSNCFQNAYPLFNNPQGMAFDDDGHLFIANKNDNSIIACQNITNQFNYTCNVAESMIQAPNNLVISEDNGYAYITEHDAGAFAICRIDTHNDTFSSCNTYKQDKHPVITKPVGITLSPNLDYLLIVESVEQHGTTIYCPLKPGGGDIVNCSEAYVSGDNVFRGKIQSTLTAIANNGLLIGSKERLFVCDSVRKFVSNEIMFHHCRQKHFLFDHISSIAYTIN